MRARTALARVTFGCIEQANLTEIAAVTEQGSGTNQHALDGLVFGARSKVHVVLGANCFLLGV